MSWQRQPMHASNHDWLGTESFFTKTPHSTVPPRLSCPEQRCWYFLLQVSATRRQLHHDFSLFLTSQRSMNPHSGDKKAALRYSHWYRQKERGQYAPLPHSIYHLLIYMELVNRKLQSCNLNTNDRHLGKTNIHILCWSKSCITSTLKILHKWKYYQEDNICSVNDNCTAVK